MGRPTRVAVAAMLLAGMPGTPAAAGEPDPRIVYLQPLGDELPDEDVAMVRDALAAFYAVQVRALPRVPLPKAAWFPARKRYRAERLLDFLKPRLPEDGFRILGLTGVDISTTKAPYADWGILGLATIDGAACVISKHRARKRSRDALHARIRLAKVAVHEIGHTLGLEHCPTYGCLMEDAGGKVATTDREHDLCPVCRRSLAARGTPAPAAPAIPWAVDAPR